MLGGESFDILERGIVFVLTAAGDDVVAVVGDHVPDTALAREPGSRPNLGEAVVMLRQATARACGTLQSETRECCR
jgi:hypothetical protein